MTGKPSGGGSPLLPDDVVSGGVLLLVAVAYGLGAMRIPSQAGEPGPGFMPMALALLLAALSLAIAVGGLRRRVRTDANGEAPSDPPRTVSASAGSLSRDAAKPWRASIATIAYAALFQPLGFVLSTLAYSGYLTSLFTEDRKLRVSVPIFVALALFVFFRVALGVRLPTGLLGL